MDEEEKILKDFTDSELLDFCISDKAKVYLQYSCDFSEIIKKNQHIGLNVACLTIWGSFFWIYIMHYLKKKS
jgi:hypothetical protein